MKAFEKALPLRQLKIDPVISLSSRALVVVAVKIVLYNSSLALRSVRSLASLFFTTRRGKKAARSCILLLLRVDVPPRNVNIE